jgi:hypothetical protein
MIYKIRWLQGRKSETSGVCTPFVLPNFLEVDEVSLFFLGGLSASNSFQHKMK